MKKFIRMIVMLFFINTNYVLASWGGDNIDCTNISHLTSLEIDQGNCEFLEKLWNANGDDWNDNSNWGTLSDVADWYGVSRNIDKITRIRLNDNNLVGDISSLNLGDESLTELRYFYINGNGLTGDISDWDFNSGNLSNIRILSISNNNLIGDISNWNLESGNLPELVYFNIDNNNLTGDISGWNIGSGNLTNLAYFNINNNLFSGDISDWNLEETNLSDLSRFDISNNKFFGKISNFDESKMEIFKIDSNNFTFDDIEPQITKISSVTRHSYSPQGKVDMIRQIRVKEGSSLTITPELTINPSGNDSYEWFKDDISLGSSSVDGRIYSKAEMRRVDEGVYTYVVTNTQVPDLTLYSQNISIIVIADENRPIISETTPVPTSNINTIPSYTFTSNQAGTITYGGDCSSVTINAVEGDNMITFDSLAIGTHNNCTITVTNSENNTSDILNISEFVIEPITQRDFYLDNLATGLNNGTSWENAYQSWADVDLEILDGGGTVYISGGTVSKTYNITAPIALHYTIDGTPDNPIIFKVSQEAGHNGMVVIDGGDVSTNIFDITNNDYIIIDGEVDGERHMRLQNWGVTVPNGVRHPAIKGSGGASGPTGSIIRYLEIINDDTSCATEACEAGVDIDYKSCIVLTSGYDRGITIEHNYLDGCIRLGIGIGSNSASGYPMGTNTVRFNEVKGYRNHKGLGGPDGIKGLGSTDVYNNIVYHEELLNAEMNPNHIAEDGIQMLGDNIRVYNNIVHGYSQGAIRHDELVTPVTNVYIYNNLVYQSHYNPEFTVQRGIQFDCDEYSNVRIYNNTIVGYNYLGLHINHRGGSPQDVSIYNNLLVDSPFRASDPLTGETISNNLSIKSDGTHGTISDSINQIFDPYDASKEFSFISYTPNTVDNDFRLTVNSNMAIDSGITADFFDYDINGNSRSIGAVWDIGAYENIVDTTPPIISETIPVPTPSTGTTPSYTFTSNEAGTITYGGDCSSVTTNAVEGDNMITFDSLAIGTHNNCTITVTNSENNTSDILNISEFVISPRKELEIKKRVRYHSSGGGQNSMRHGGYNPNKQKKQGIINVTPEIHSVIYKRSAKFLQKFISCKASKNKTITNRLNNLKLLQGISGVCRENVTKSYKVPYKSKKR